VNFRKIKGGTYHFITDVKGELVKFIYEASPTEIYEIEKDFEGYIAQRKRIPSNTVNKSGRRNSFLSFEAMDAIGEQDSLTIAFAEILAWEIDFYKDVREGIVLKWWLRRSIKQISSSNMELSMRSNIRGRKNHQRDSI